MYGTHTSILSRSRRFQTRRLSLAAFATPRFEWDQRASRPSSCNRVDLYSIGSRYWKPHRGSVGAQAVFPVLLQQSIAIEFDPSASRPPYASSSDSSPIFLNPRSAFDALVAVDEFMIRCYRGLVVIRAINFLPDEGRCEISSAKHFVHARLSGSVPRCRRWTPT